MEIERRRKEGGGEERLDDDERAEKICHTTLSIVSQIGLLSNQLILQADK
jgi:hypothetical protein